MRQVLLSRRAWAAHALRLALASVPLALAGCGEREAAVVPSGKSRQDLEDDIDNPYGGEVKSTIRKKKGGRSAR